MTLASEIANMLTEKGYTGLKPWTSKKTFGYERIYFHLGFVELSGKFGFRAEKLELFPEFVSDAKACLIEYQEQRAKKYVAYDLPF